MNIEITNSEHSELNGIYKKIPLQAVLDGNPSISWVTKESDNPVYVKQISENVWAVVARVLCTDRWLNIMTSVDPTTIKVRHDRFANLATTNYGWLDGPPKTLSTSGHLTPENINEFLDELRGNDWDGEGQPKFKEIVADREGNLYEYYGLNSGRLVGKPFSRHGLTTCNSEFVAVVEGGFFKPENKDAKEGRAAFELWGKVESDRSSWGEATMNRYLEIVRETGYVAESDR